MFQLLSKFDGKTEKVCYDASFNVVLACYVYSGYSLGNWSAFEMQYAALGLLLFPFRSMASACVYTVFVGKCKT